MASARFASSHHFVSGLTVLLTTSKTGGSCYVVVGTSNDTGSTKMWPIHGTGRALARSSSGLQAVFGAIGSTTVGYTIPSSSFNAITVSTSGTASVVAWMGGTSAGAPLFITTCTTKAMSKDDTVSIPGINVRIANPAAS